MSDAVTISIDAKAFNSTITRLGDIEKKHSREILHAMAMYYEKCIIGLSGVFNKQGARDGQEAWRGFADSTMAKNKHGTGKIRYGTDRPAYGSPGVYVKNARRYTATSKILQAGGMFRNSFRIHGATADSIKFGTMEQILGASGAVETADIIGDRPVLTITENDQKRMGEILLKSIRKALTKK